MQINIIGKNIEVTEAIKNDIEIKLEKLEKYFINKELNIDVVVRTYSVGQKIEITVKIDKNHTLRQEVVENDLYSAINRAIDRLENQIKRFKGRLIARNKKEKISEILAADIKEEQPQKIIKRKKIEDKLMSEEEALLQFDLSGHDFFVFIDSEENIPKILYKRKDKAYGILELD